MSSKLTSLAVLLRNEYATLHKSMQEQQKQHTAMQTVHNVKERQDQLRLEKLALMLIKEENLLSLCTCTWTLNVAFGKPVLCSKERANDKKVMPLTDLTQTDYHSTFYFRHFDENNLGHGKQIVLRYDDNDIRLVFDDPKYIAPFIDEYSLKVDTSGIDKEIAKLQTTIDSLNGVKALLS